MEKNVAAFLLLTFLQFISCERIRSSFGEFCNTTHRCDSRQSLTCKNETCQCLMKETMIFDTELNKCAVLAGEKCSYTAVEIQNDENNGGENEKVWREELPCITNAQCSSGYCNCIDYFTESSNGSCKARGRYGADCESNSDCRTELICERGKCDCNSNLVYHPVLLTCVKKAGQSCQDNNDCPFNADCNEVEVDYGSWDFKCVCDKNYFPSVDGSCQRKGNYGEACEVEEGCLNNLHLSCKNHTCQCNENSVLDKNKCVIKAGSSCKSIEDFEEEYFECVGYSECQSNYDEYDEKYICKCNSGFYQVNGICILKAKFNESCEDDGQCQSEPFLNLKCVNNRCACRNGANFNSETNNCVQFYNQTCQYGQDVCVPNAYCNSRCYCVSGYSGTSSGYCHAGVGTSCGTKGNPPCNSENGLICVDGQCQCEFNKLQIVENDKCKSLVWGPCSANSTNISCTDNAECSEVTSGVSVCLCKEGFVPVDRKCELAHGQACNYSVPCDRRAPLSCIEGICKCRGNQYYDDEEMKCKGLFGAMCEVNKNDFCAGRTFCKPFRGFEMINFGVCNCSKGLVPSKDRKSCFDLKLYSTY